jgi:nucleoside-diphosphate-sugar epimerase
VRILLTGASSFTGSWFARELAAAGHEVVATFRRAPEGYEGLRRSRVEGLLGVVRAAHGVSFGDDAFLALVDREGPFDLLCHHAAEATDYRSADFDAVAALARNTHRLGPVLRALRGGGTRAVLLTGSVFEGGEGAGSEGLPHFSPYGLSKALTARVVEFEAARAGLGYGKFVIPNPFGPWEEARFTHHLIRSWLAGRTPAVRTPAYVRDNIHVSLLALAYVDFAQRVADSRTPLRLGPSGYVESQGRFAERVAAALEPRLGVPCPLEQHEQSEFAEPRVRVNTHPLDARRLGWDEAKAWDALAAYYSSRPHGEEAG